MINLKDKIQLVKDYFYYGFGQLINLIVPLLVAPKVISTCGMENWGKVGVALSVTAFISIIVDFGSNIIGVKEVSEHKHNHQNLKSVVVDTFMTKFFSLVGVCFICSFVLLYFLKEDQLMYLFSLSFIIAQAFNPLWFFQGVQNYKKINQIIFLSKFLYFSLVYLFINIAQDYIYVIGFLGLSNFIVYSFYFFILMKIYEFKLNKINIASVVSKMKRDVYITVSNLSISYYISLPIIIVKIFLNDYYAGIFKIGEMCLGLLRSYLSVFFNVSFPKFCERYFDDIHKAYTFLKKSSIVNIALLFFGCGMTLLMFLIGKDFFVLNEEQLMISKLILNMLPISIIIAFNIPFNQALMVKNKIKGLSVISFLSALIITFLCIFLTQRFGLYGTVFSIYSVEFCVTGLVIYYYFSNLKIT